MTFTVTLRSDRNVPLHLPAIPFEHYDVVRNVMTQLEDLGLCVVTGYWIDPDN